MTTGNAIEILRAVAALGGRLIAERDCLRTFLPRDCPSDLKAALRAQKFNLIALLRLNFLIIERDSVSGAVFWAPDKHTKAVLIEQGASPGAVFTASELRSLASRGAKAIPVKETNTRTS